MLSPRLSKILAKKNVPHEDGMWWVHVDSPMLHVEYIGQSLNVDYVLVPEKDCEFKIWDEEGDGDYSPAYPEIALFKYAKVVFGERCMVCNKKLIGCYSEVDHSLVRLACPNYEHSQKSKSWQHHTHTLADLFSSGASDEEIENYVLESLG